MSNKGKLTDKQEIFAQEYLIDLNATQAAIRAGYSDDTATEQASRMLTNVKVSARIAELKAERMERVQVDQDFVISGLTTVAKRCMQAVPVLEWNPDLKGMAQKVDAEGNGVWEFDSAGANRSLELLGKHLGIFEKDNRQKGSTVTVSFKDAQ